MKRIQSACILQTLVFSQKAEHGYTRDQALQLNRNEFEQYKSTLERTRTRYQVTDVQESEDGAVIVRVRKQYNAKAGVDEYFN